jgi:pilus assembly protein Flp/PilA
MLSYFMYATNYVWARLRRDEGVTAVEYGLILALIAGVIIVALIFLGNALSGLFTNAGNCVKTPTGCTGP